MKAHARSKAHDYANDYSNPPIEFYINFKGGKKFTLLMKRKSLVFKLMI
jgi:hypothetical protein